MGLQIFVLGIIFTLLGFVISWILEVCHVTIYWNFWVAFLVTTLGATFFGGCIWIIECFVMFINLFI